MYTEKKFCVTAEKHLEVTIHFLLYGNLLQFICFQLNSLQIIPFTFNQTNPHKLINSLKVF